VHDDRGSIIVGWLTKVAVILTLVGVVGFDLISVATTKMSAADDATNAARIGSETYIDTRGDVQRAYAASLRYAEKHGATIEPSDFEVEADGTVHVRIVKTATTIVFYRNSTSKKWAHVVANGDGRAA
jgi:hypothetical protein